MSRPAKILLVQTANSNLGDNVIADNHAWLIKKAAGLRKIHIFNYSIASRDIGQIKYADAVIFAGGILKITNEKFCLYIPEIIQEAERHGIPVYMSNFGVEQFYADDERSQALKEAVNLPCVKGIAARDDIETLKRDYLEGENVSKAFPVTDIAIWSARSYKKYLKETRPNSPYYRKDTFLKDSSSGKSDAPIGLGIVRHRLFEDYGHPEVTKDIQMDFWLGVIDELDRRSLKWVIFTNGDAYDEEFAREVLEKAGRGSKLPAPLDGAALVRMISGFKGVIAGRMHSNIISYALGLPSVGFIWNRKLEFWGQKIGHPERFLKVDEMDPVKAVDILVSALDRPCGPSKDMLYAIRTPLKEFLKKWVFTSEPSIHRVSFSHEKLAHTLAANHLGTLRCRYPGTDSYEALCSSAYNGFRNFIADLRLTSDGELICINRWHKDTYKMLGFDCSCLEDPGKGISSEEISSLQYNNRYNVMTFDKLAEGFSHTDMLISDAYSEFGFEPKDKAVKERQKALKENAPQLVLAVGRPERNDLALMIKKIRETVSKYDLDTERMIFRLEKKGDIEYAAKELPEIRLMYYFVADRAMLDDPQLRRQKYRELLAYCVKNDIPWAAAGYRIFEPLMVMKTHDLGLKYCIFSDSNTDFIVNAVNAGCDMVGCATYPVDYLSDLMS